MATERNLWQPLAILAIVAAIILAVLLNRKGQREGVTELPAKAPTVSSDPQPKADNPEPKLSSQISVLLKDADPKVRARALALLAAWKPEEIKARAGEMLAKDSDVDVKFAALSAICWADGKSLGVNPLAARSLLSPIAPDINSKPS